MEEHLQTSSAIMEDHLQTSSTTTNTPYNDDMMDISNCSTPYVSAPSSPRRTTTSNNSNYSYYYSAPASPMHYLLSSSSSDKQQIPSSTNSDNFDFHGSTSSSGPIMTSADELFFNGQIRPIKLSTHLQRPQILSPLIDADEDDDDPNINNIRGRDINLLSKSLRRTRSMSLLRNTTSFQEEEEGGGGEKIGEGEKETETTPCGSGNSSSSRSSSVGRSSKRWVLFKEFLYRSKSEGRNNPNTKFWNNLSFSHVLKEKKQSEEKVKIPKMKSINNGGIDEMKKKKKRVNGVMGKRKSAHEMHYTANRAQAEEMRKKTFLPYRQGLLGCLGFTSTTYGAWNGFAKAFNHVSST